jgi:hypothetical protein
MSTADALLAVQLGALDLAIATGRGLALVRDSAREADTAATPLQIATSAHYFAEAATALREVESRARTLAEIADSTSRGLAVESGFVPPTSAD